MEANNNNKIKKYFRKDPNSFYINEKGEYRCRSVHFESQFRFSRAQEEAQKEVVSVKKIINYVNEFLIKIGVPQVLNPKMNLNEINYDKIKKEYQLADERDLLWIKFTADGFIGVIAQSNDINFDFPPSADVYNKKAKGRNWIYNTSGIIVHKLNKEWDKSFVLVFPLKIKNTKYSRHEIETAVGNYLIDKGVPILDYYSHNY